MEPVGEHDAPFHVGDAGLRGFHRSGRAPDVADAGEDGGEVVGVEGENFTADNRGDDLALRYCAHVANPLREHEIRLEERDGVDVDLVHAAMVPQRCADGRVNLTARQPFEVDSRPR